MPFEEPMDEGDIAADYAARHNRDSINRVLAGARAAGPVLQTTNCEWCEVDIPEVRRQAVPGCTMCVDCQSVKERLRNGL